MVKIITCPLQMNLIAKLNHPYIVEYKDAWVDKVLVGFLILDFYGTEVHHQYSFSIEQFLLKLGIGEALTCKILHRVASYASSPTIVKVETCKYHS